MRKLKVKFKNSEGQSGARAGEEPVSQRKDSDVSLRQEKVLETVVDEYIRRAFPISSDFLKNEVGLNVSSATIRLDFADLADKGYLEKTYISSGRVPTDKGYRFFVNSLLKKKKRKKKNQFKKMLEREGDWLHRSRQIAESLAQLSSNLSITQLKEEDIFWKEGWERVAQTPEFKDIDYFKSFLKMVQQFEEEIDKLAFGEGVRAFIGQECPLKEKDFSMVVGRKNNNSFALLGPKRMDFRRNISLIDSLMEAVESL